MTSVCWKVQTMSPRKILERCTGRLLIVLKGTSVAKNTYLANTTKKLNENAGSFKKCCGKM